MSSPSAPSSSIRIVLTYVLLASLWIAVSDLAVAIISSVPLLGALMLAAKGLLFVGCTALLLHHLISRNINLLNESHGRALEFGRVQLLEAEDQARRLRHANRFFAVLSAVNRAITLKPGRKELIQEICRILVEVGEFRMAWFGVPDSQGWIVPDASFGDSSGYLAGIRVSIAAIPEGRGPTGTALRENRPVIFNDIPSNPAMLPWREQAARNGFKSSACFPVTLPTGAVAGFTIYSAERELLFADEERLLAEICAGIGYSLEFAATEAHLEQERILLKTLVGTIPDLIWLKDREGIYLSCNPSFERFCGAAEAEIIGRSALDFEDAEHIAFSRSKDLEAMADRCSSTYDTWVTFADDGHRALLEVITSPVIDAGGEVIGILGVGRDVTARSQAEAYRELGRDILQILNESGELSASIRRVAELLKNRTGFDAVGIRLKEGDDFPYIVQHGFAQGFLLQENTLLLRDVSGGVCRDSAGNAMLECLCGLVLSGKIDADNPLFTTGGSCLVNDACRLGELPPSILSGEQLRGLCFREGYASVALIPIRNAEGIVGLIQFNDRRQGQFTPEMVDRLEGIAAHIGGALIRTRAEEALRESEDRYRSLVENLPLGVSLIDPNHRIVTVNRAQAELFGHAPEWYVGRSCFEAFAKRERVCSPCPGRLSIESGRPGVVEKEGVREDGSWFAVRICTVPLVRGDGESRGFIEVVEEITERREGEEALRRSVERFRQLFEQHGDAIILIDPDLLTIIESNRQMERLFGFAPDELVAGGVSLFFPAEASAEVESMIRGITGAGWLRLDRVAALRKDGIPLFVAIWGSMITLPHGEVCCLSFRDITERIRLQEEAQSTQAKLIQSDKMASLGLLASGLAHEINNPNNYIMSNAESLAKIWRSALPILDGFYQEFGDFNLGEFPFSGCREIAPRMFAGLVTGSQRIRSIVDLLKNFARQDSGKTSDPVDVNTVILDAITILNHEIKRSCENFELKTGYALPPLRGNAQQIEQVIINLLLNSLQALPDKSCAIRIVSSVSEEPRRIVITIEDEGVGMSPEVLARITEPFFTTKGESGGTGLGLSISASILKDNHASLSFASEPGRGTTATLLFQPF